MGFHGASSVFLGLSPPPSLTSAQSDENNDTLTSSTSASTSATVSTCPSSPSSRVAFSKVRVSNGNQNRNSSPNENVNATVQPQHQRLQREWKQKSIVRRASSVIQSEVTQMIRQSAFLNRPDIVAASSATTIPLFHRSEVQIGALVGSGGFSNVYQVTAFCLDATISEQCTVEQQVQREQMVERVRIGAVKLVIKHLKRALANSSTKAMSRAASDLVMEATYMSAMNHPHILPVRALPFQNLHAYDAGDYDGYFIIMDELSNTLSDEIQEWKKDVTTAPSVTDKMDYALQIASALEYLHTFCQVVYRDLKPSNIGFDINTGTVQLFDFGLCRELPRTTTIDTTIDNTSCRRNDENRNVEIEDDVYEMSGVGTRRYMAPEIINDGKYNNKVDVYSWSMLVSELITGTKPYVNYDMETHRVAVCQGGERPDIPFECYPAWVRVILHNTWCESVTDRWSARQVLYYLSSIIHDDDVDDDGVGAYRARSEYGAVPQFLARQNLSIFPKFPDSPVDVQRWNEIDVYPSDWLLLPEFPDLRDENGHVPCDIAPTPTRRHTLHPRLPSRERKHVNDDDTSGLRFRPTAAIDGLTTTISDLPTAAPPPLTICQVNGNVEMVFRQIPTPALAPRPFSFHQYRANSCTVN